MSLQMLRPRFTNEHGCREPATYLCVCGAELQPWNAMDNECDRCHRNYNAFGQEVKPMSECRDHDDY